MDKRRINYYRRLQKEVAKIERDYTSGLIDAMTEEGDEAIEALEGNQAALKEEIQKLKVLLDDPFAVDEEEVDKTDRPMKPYP